MPTPAVNQMMPPPRRGVERQRPRREREQRARQEAADFGRRLRDLGESWHAAASCLDLAPRTLRSWQRLPSSPSCAPTPRGRPCRDATIERRSEVRELLTELGPHAGVPRLRRAFPDVARSELAELKTLERLRRRSRREEYTHRLLWHRPGSVWAMDYAEPPLPIDGVYRALLSVRDLASGKQLAWLPAPEATAEQAAAALEALFREHGAPLVLKSDNGSPFTADRTVSLLAAHEVASLLSPPYTPRYNGACEAGIGGLKTRTHHLAALDGRPGLWSSEDVEAARRMADEEHYPRRLRGLTAAETWQARTPPTADERRRFRDVVVDHEQEIRKQRGHLLEEDLGRARQASLDRRAVSRALVELGYLSLLRSDITPHIKFV
jgi:transposase InsO family protein